MEQKLERLPENGANGDGKRVRVWTGEEAEEEALTGPSEEKARVASALLGEMTPCPDDARMEYMAYGRRWYILAVVMLLNGSNAFSWIGYAPVANYVDEYYGWQAASNWLSMVFLVAAVPVAFFSMWSVRRFGLRSAILIAGVANGLGSLVRLSSSLPGLEPNQRLICVLAGQVMAASAYPFIMFLPTKVSGAWFPADQRTLATTLMILSNPLGVLLANLISPQLVTEVWMVLLLNVVTMVPSVAGGLMAVLGVCHSEPPTPPSASAAAGAELAFFAGVRKCLKSRNYWWLLLALGGGIGMFNALYTVMQQMLCPTGYSNSFSGLCCILMIVGGVCGSMATSYIVDKTGWFEETMKTGFCLAVLAGVGLAQWALISGIAPLIAITCFAFGVFGLAAYTVGMELASECTYPVTETTSAGFIVLSGQIQGVAYIALLTLLAKPLHHHSDHHHHEVCTKVQGIESGKENVIEPKDMTLSLLVFSGLAVAIAVTFTCLFRPKLRRREMERAATTAASLAAAANQTNATTLSAATTPGTNTEPLTTPVKA